MQEENIRLKTQMNVATYTEKIKVPVSIKVLLIVNKIIMEISNCAWCPLSKEVSTALVHFWQRKEFEKNTFILEMSS